MAASNCKQLQKIHSYDTFSHYENWLIWQTAAHKFHTKLSLRTVVRTTMCEAYGDKKL